MRRPPTSDRRGGQNPQWQPCPSVARRHKTFRTDTELELQAIIDVKVSSFSPSDSTVKASAAVVMERVNIVWQAAELRD